MKKAQEEMIGFGIIIAIVAIILLVFLVFALNNNEKEFIESYEIDSFLSSVLQYTSKCKDNLGYLDIEKLILNCYENKKCLNQEDSCEVLEKELKKISEKSWNLDNTSSIKGYKLVLSKSNSTKIKIINGNLSANYKGAAQSLSRGTGLIELKFNAYY